MLKTFDIVLIAIMTTAATATYTIKHRAELKLEQVHKLESEIKLEKDTIDLLKADWALAVQPARLERLVTLYNEDLKLQPTDSTAIVQPNELPMLRSQLPQPDIIADLKNGKGGKKTSAESADALIRQVIADVASKPAPASLAKKRASPKQTDPISTGSVRH